MKELSLKLRGGTKEEQKEAALKVSSNLSIATLPVIASPERLESELKSHGLEDRYRPHFAYIRKVMPEIMLGEGLPGAYERTEKQYIVVLHYTAMLQDLLDKKREALFSDYLPK